MLVLGWVEGFVYMLVLVWLMVVFNVFLLVPIVCIMCGFVLCLLFGLCVH